MKLQGRSALVIGGASGIGLASAAACAEAGAVRQTVERFGKLDVLVCSPGANPAQHADWHFAGDIYLKGPYYACRHALPHMLDHGGGRSSMSPRSAVCTSARSTRGTAPPRERSSA